MTDKKFFECSLELSSEFDRYVLLRPDIAEKIPSNALIIFLLENDEEFNKKSLAIAHKRRERKQPVVKIKVQKILPPLMTRLVNPKLELSARI